ncbi:hypothetical protein SESBI_04481 [Sesbania bispinosa]|nr:hypothetical protein SESBI_04481 [Sesbania bispinosa]
MSQRVAIHPPPHPVPFSSTTESNSFSSSLCFRFRFGFPSRASPLISILCFGRQTCPWIGGAIPLRQEGSLQDEPASFLHLQPICSEAHFDRVIADAHQREDAVLVVW